MSIETLAEPLSFFLHAGDATYALTVTSSGHLAHLHWGGHLAAQDLTDVFTFRDRAFSPNPAGEPRGYSLDTFPLEYPVFGNSDFRAPALEIFQPADGSRVVDLRYKNHKIIPGKPALPGLPATYVESPGEADTLVITLVDTHLGVEVDLSYTAYAALPVIARSARIINGGPASLELRRALSCSVDFPATYGRYEFLHLSGAWARERDVVHAPLRRGTQSIESRRGTSSHQHNPFFALTELSADEERGSAYGFNLVYSGNFLASVEQDSHDSTRAQIGINPFDFSWQLAPGDSFQTPEAILVYSAEGLGGMSRAYHRLYRTRLCRGIWRDQERPILVNNWEATYFDFDAAKLEKIAGAAADLGIELFVLDDGWFGKRDDDRSSLGDWVVDKKKLPGGLEDLAAKINAKGVKFGLWFEPEMISADSDLQRAHPDWHIHVPGRAPSEGRNQRILDFSRQEVVDEIYRQMAEILRRVPIAYIKWDMNRHMTEAGSVARGPGQQQETAHRFVLGVYALMERLTNEFPEVLFEGCSGGGGRFDPGILYYMPQIWTSDNSDAISRLRLQYGTSIAYPWSSIAAHVSVVPNHQVHRVAPFRTRGEVAFTGAFGYELDLSDLSDEDREEVKRQTEFYKKHRALLVSGDLYRLRSPFRSNETAWMVVAPDRSQAIVTFINILAEPNPIHARLPLRGLDPEATYRIEPLGLEVRGDALQRIGLRLDLPKGDFISLQWVLTKVG